MRSGEACHFAIASLLSNGQCDIYTLDWAAIKYQHTAAVQASLLERYAPSTASKIMCEFRRVLDEASKLGLMSTANYANAIDLASIRNNSKLRGRALSRLDSDLAPHQAKIKTPLM